MKIKYSELLVLLESIKKKNDVLKAVEGFPDEINREIDAKYIMSKVILKILESMSDTDEFDIPEDVSSGVDDIRQVNVFLADAIRRLIDKFKSPECQDCKECLSSLPALEELIADEPEVTVATFNVMSQTIGSIQ